VQRAVGLEAEEAHRDRFLAGEREPHQVHRELAGQLALLRSRQVLREGVVAQQRRRARVGDGREAGLQLLCVGERLPAAGVTRELERERADDLRLGEELQRGHEVAATERVDELGRQTGGLERLEKRARLHAPALGELLVPLLLVRAPRGDGLRVEAGRRLRVAGDQLEERANVFDELGALGGGGE
jgi:hypothetical protein